MKMGCKWIDDDDDDDGYDRDDDRDYHALCLVTLTGTINVSDNVGVASQAQQ